MDSFVFRNLNLKSTIYNGFDISSVMNSNQVKFIRHSREYALAEMIVNVYSSLFLILLTIVVSLVIYGTEMRLNAVTLVIMYVVFVGLCFEVYNLWLVLKWKKLPIDRVINKRVLRHFKYSQVSYNELIDYIQTLSKK